MISLDATSTATETPGTFSETRNNIHRRVEGPAVQRQTAPHQNIPETEPLPTGLTVRSVFCPQDVNDPFDTVQWAKQTATIKGEGGSVFFKQDDCEFPTTWSQLAVNVVASKYFYGERGTSEREKSMRQVIHRVSRTIADWGVEDGYFASKRDGETFYRELTWLLLHQYGSFNSPVWFNVGLAHQYGVKGTKCTWHWDEQAGEATQPDNPFEYPQASACFIQSVNDDMESIMDLARSEAMLFKFGSGTGTDLSTIRSSSEKLSGGGKPSGPLSFMRVYDQIAGVVKSGGKTRRAAKMQSLKVTHPDIMEFIDCKQREEEKARILMQHGLDYENAYSSVLYQNANLSVRLTDDFMQSVKENKTWTTRWVTDATKSGPEYPAREVFDKIASTAWACGDPGVQFDTIINRWHTCPHSGRINASNPCSEYMSLDDTACNLASINLMKFRQEGGLFDAERFVDACRIFFIAQEIIVDRASYPIKKISENSHKFRAIGLGYSNLGSLIMSLGLPYDSDESRGLCSVITALLHGAAFRTSAELAQVAGPFDAYPENKLPMLSVIEMHWDAVNRITNCQAYLKKRAQQLWDDVLNMGRRYGFRNAQATVLAPTGTISFMMDCDTTGIEPDIALVKYKQLAGGGNLKMVNNTVPLALQTLGYSEDEITKIVAHIHQHDTLTNAPCLLDEHLPVFDCAFPSPGSGRCIPWDGHVKMMAAAQPFISGAISKTVNMPGSATVEDVANAYMLAWELGVKALAIYRDGSKSAQPLSTAKESDKKETVSADAASRVKKSKPTPRRERLPDTRNSMTHKFNVSGHEGYVTVGLYPDGRVGELFITMAKEGSTIGGLMDCFGTAISMSLQYGVPLRVYVEKFSHTRFEPMGHTKNPDIPIAKSLFDYIFRWLGRTFLPDMQSVQQDPQNHHGTNGHHENRNGLNSMNGLHDLTATEPERRCGVASKDKDTSETQATGTTSKLKKIVTETKPVSLASAPRTSALSSPETIVNVSVVGSTVAMTDELPDLSNRLSPHLSSLTMSSLASADEQYSSFQSDAPLCDACGSISVRAGNCYLCYNCGKSMGCS